MHMDLADQPVLMFRNRTSGGIERGVSAQRRNGRLDRDLTTSAALRAGEVEVRGTVGEGPDAWRCRAAGPSPSTLRVSTSPALAGEVYL